MSNPTIHVCKSIAGLVEQQLAAGRIKAEQVGTFMDEVRNLIETYHTSNGLLLSPVSVSLSSFSYFFTIVRRRDRAQCVPRVHARGGRRRLASPAQVWIYTSAPLIATSEFGEVRSLGESSGFIFAMAYSFVLSLFMFGLYEAGKVIEAPLSVRPLPLCLFRAGVHAERRRCADGPQLGPVGRHELHPVRRSDQLGRRP